MSSEFGLVGPKPSWACPNDRQLALRAKLRSGWSLKTSQLNAFPKPQPLTEKEQQMIVSVVKKAEEMDLTEQQRVGKLVDRLESLKKIASGNGVTECILCGDSFGLSVFGRSNYKCHDCHKAVCRKCVVELSSAKGGSPSKDSVLRLCKLCSENRELIKKSGAWFYKGVPKYILPEKKNHYTNSYEKYAASPRYQEQKYVSRYISASPTPGPVSSTTPTTTTGNSSSGVTTSTVTAPTSTSASQSRPVGFFWSRNLQHRSQSDQDNESSSGDEGSMTASLMTRTASKQQLQSGRLKSTSPVGGVRGSTASNNRPSGGMMSRSPELAPGATAASAPGSRHTQKNARSSDSSPIPGSSSTDEPYLLTARGSHGELPTQSSSSASPSTHLTPSSMEYYGSSKGDLSGRQKSIERFEFTGSSTPPNNGDNNPKSSGSSSTDCLFQPSTSNPSISNSSTATTSQQSQQSQSSPLGIIEVALSYDDSQQALHCSVHHAKDLTPMDINGLSDPYCILKLIPSRFEGTHLRTKTISKSVNPIFNETLTFYGVTTHDLTWQTLQILVMDDDRWGKDCLGTTQIPLHRLRAHQTRCFAQSLERGRLSEERVWGRGRLLLSLTYLSEKSLLLVGIVQATDLPALDAHGSSDPFVKVRLLHDTSLGALSSSCFSINRKFRTSVKWRTLNPEFREEFSLKVSFVDLPRLALAISVWDKDLGKNDDYIGGIVLSAGSKGERLRHWLDMMKLTNTKHFKWHTLSPSELPNH